MRGYKLKRIYPALSVLLMWLIAAGCGAVDKGAANSSPGTIVSDRSAGTAESQTQPSLQEKEEPCGAIIEWADFLMINDVNFSYNYEGAKGVITEQIGDKIGEVTYMLNDHACTDHVAKNGDAAFLPIGTPIYAMKGYKTSYRVIAHNKMYEVQHNPNAKTMGDLLDIQGKFEKVSLESGEDGSHIGDFTPEASAVYVEELLPLPYVGFDEVYKKAGSESGVFLRVHLQDGTSFRMVYYPIANAFTAGAFGSERLKETIMGERTRIKAAAGM